MFSKSRQANWGGKRCNHDGQSMKKAATAQICACFAVWGEGARGTGRGGKEKVNKVICTRHKIHLIAALSPNAQTAMLSKISSSQTYCGRQFCCAISPRQPCIY